MKRKAGETVPPTSIYPLRLITHDILADIKAGTLATAQKRTGAHKKYVAMPADSPIVYKGPYKERNMRLEFRSHCFERVLGVKYEVDKERPEPSIYVDDRALSRILPIRGVVKDPAGNYWYEFRSVAPVGHMDHWKTSSWKESDRLGGTTVNIVERWSTGLLTGMEIWDSVPDVFTQNLDAGARKALIAMFMMGVGDVQAGSNFLFHGHDGIWIDYEENTTRNIQDAPLGNVLFKSRISNRFDSWMEAHLRSRKDCVAKEIAELHAQLFAVSATAMMYNEPFDAEQAASRLAVLKQKMGIQE